VSASAATAVAVAVVTNRIDRPTVLLLVIAGFLVLLALLAWQVRTRPAPPAPTPVAVVRKIYKTTVIKTIPWGAGPAGTSVSQSSSGSQVVAAAPVTTHTS
jgi:hypothetical protein